MIMPVLVFPSGKKQVQSIINMGQTVMSEEKT